MRVLLATADPVRLSFLLALLRDAGLSPVVLDAHVSAVEAALTPFPRQLAVPEAEADQAGRVLREAGEAAE
jgi:Tfp pilus assembly PilM family ATPase